MGEEDGQDNKAQVLPLGKAVDCRRDAEYTGEQGNDHNVEPRASELLAMIGVAETQRYHTSRDVRPHASDLSFLTAEHRLYVHAASTRAAAHLGPLPALRGRHPRPVYLAPVRHTIDTGTRLWSHRVGGPAESASFAAFDFDRPVTVTVRPTRAFSTATLLPSSAHVTPRVREGLITFTLERPRHVTLLLDGSNVHPLHLFCSPPETDIPDSHDPQVVYLGPGVHLIDTLELHSNQTLYLAPGAVLRGQLTPQDKGTYSEKWQVTFHGPLLHAKGASNITIRGRGIIDSSLLPHPARTALLLDGCSNVLIDGPIFLNSSNWSIDIRNSHHVEVQNVKQISGRLNSDGIDSVSSHHVHIHDCFVRNRDDSIVVKTTLPGIPAHDIRVERCTIWTDWGYSLGVSYETRTHLRCDLHRLRHHSSRPLGPGHPPLRLSTRLPHYVRQHPHPPTPHGRPAACSRAQFISLLIQPDIWGTDNAPGQIRDITFTDITATTADGQGLLSTVHGFDATHRVENVTLRNLTLNGQPLRTLDPARFDLNAHTADIRIVGP